MQIHFIAIGGSAMHNLAIALHLKGYLISGSDDEIFEPSRSRLKACGLLPEDLGWFPEKNIHTGLDAVILGMHARADNPELIRARDLKLKIFSYPEFLYEQSVNKTRVVIGGSHGKTTITAMILHALAQTGIDSDYMVGAKLEGYEVMVRLSEKAPFMVMEGDEYLSSPLDRRPKFHLYHPHIALISGIAWDHINVFPSFDNYVEQFRLFVRSCEPGAKIIYCADDEHVKRVCREEQRPDMQWLPYDVPDYQDMGTHTWLMHNNQAFCLKIFGRHNMLNLEGARLVCHQMGMDAESFYRAMESFQGASRRLEMIYQDKETSVYRDFAHAPSKVRATVEAAREHHPGEQLIACLELHTFSSLNRAFLQQYQGSLEKADHRLVFFSPKALLHKKLPELDPREVSRAFGLPEVRVFTAYRELQQAVQDIQKDIQARKAVLLLMSSGNFEGLTPFDFLIKKAE